MSRAGEGKNESSAGKRVIVAEGSGGQGRAGQKGTMPLSVDIGSLQLGGRYQGNMWAMRTKQPRTAQCFRRAIAVRILMRAAGQRSLVVAVWRRVG